MLYLVVLWYRLCILNTLFHVFALMPNGLVVVVVSVFRFYFVRFRFPFIRFSRVLRLWSIIFFIWCDDMKVYDDGNDGNGGDMILNLFFFSYFCIGIVKLMLVFFSGFIGFHFVLFWTCICSERIFFFAYKFWIRVEIFQAHAWLNEECKRAPMRGNVILCSILSFCLKIVLKMKWNIQIYINITKMLNWK